LTIVVEDESGPRIPEKGTAPEGEQAIDLGTFYHDFIQPGRGSASVYAEVEGPAAEARMTSLLETIERNRHSPGRGQSRD
jgi:hypothetical protein